MNTLTARIPVPVKTAPLPVQRERQAPAAPGPPPPAPTKADRIRARAFEIFQARQRLGAPGDANLDWAQAECEVNGSSPGPTVSGDVEAKCRARGESFLAGDGK